jgi:hypothetical protein
MFLVDLLGAALTVLAIGALLLGGYLAALRLLGERAQSDPLALAVASLLLAMAEAIAVGVALGALGWLRIQLALALQLALTLALLLDARRRLPPGGVGAPLTLTARRTWAICAEHWAPALLTVHAVGSEALRGLLRPPLSWDALMYHLLLAGTWLRDQNLAPVLGNIPVNYYGYAPANGSVWFWWWMAPSHSELYVNLASLLPWALLALATGAVARELGAVRRWPLAAFLVALAPTVVRFAATEYVDLFLAAAALSGFFFALRWRRDAEWSDALLFGVGLGLAAGTKVLGIAYGLATGAAALALARGRWGRRAAQVAALLGMVALLGSYFYLRNVAVGAGPLAVECERTATGPDFSHDESIPRPNSVARSWDEMIRGGRLLEAFLGTTHAQSLELGVGPVTLILLVAVLALPWLAPRERRRESWMAALVVWAALLFWLTVPFARHRHVYANVRYLLPVLGLAFAAIIAFAQRRRLSDRLLEGLCVAVLAQDLLQLHAAMPFAARVAIAIADVVAVALILAPAVREVAARRWREIAAACLALALLAAPWLARFRVADRDRALATELTVHLTSARFFAGGWAWLDAHAGDGNVAVVHVPNNYLTYPEMGPRLERDARYVNVNEADLPHAILYPSCQPRVDFDPAAWLRNLERRDVRWLHLGRFPGFDYGQEGRWAESLPQLFALRFEDATNRIYEVRLRPPAPTAAGSSP